MKLTKNKYFLYATGFFSGMSIMAVEMGASRLLTPYFSSSQIVWTVIIGTIMIAMAIGNVWGGRSADKNPDPARLYRRLLIAAAWIALIPFLGRFVILGVTYVVIQIAHSQYLIWASLFSCLLIFVFPLLLLGTVTPSLIKYATTSLEDNGKVVGMLEACGTIGSILGTFLPTFVTIPDFGTAVTFYIFAAILALLALLFFMARGKGRAAAAATTAIIAALIFIPFDYSFAFWESDIVYEDESIYNYLRVQETERSVILSTNVLEGVQSIYMKNGGLTGMYYDYALAAPLMTADGPARISADRDQVEVEETGNPRAQSLLVLGMGTGTYAKQCRTFYPGMEIEGVEIDQKIVDLSHRYFDLPEDIPVAVEDGRAYLRNAGTYDIIMVDAYQDITIPFQMSTVEFFEMVKDHLNPGGVLVLNMNMKQNEPGGINDYIIDTVSAVFPSTLTVPVGANTNLELFASMDEGIDERFEERVAHLTAGELREQMVRVRKNLVTETGGDLILTDDKAPVERLGMKALDAIIKDALDDIGDISDYF